MIAASSSLKCVLIGSLWNEFSGSTINPIENTAKTCDKDRDKFHVHLTNVKSTLTLDSLTRWQLLTTSKTFIRRGMCLISFRSLRAGWLSCWFSSAILTLRCFPLPSPSLNDFYPFVRRSILSNPLLLIPLHQEHWTLRRWQTNTINIYVARINWRPVWARKAISNVWSSLYRDTSDKDFSFESRESLEDSAKRSRTSNRYVLASLNRKSSLAYTLYVTGNSLGIRN